MVVRWESANWTDHKSIDEFFVRNMEVLDVFKFVSFLDLKFLLHYPRKVSIITSKVKQTITTCRAILHWWELIKIVTSAFRCFCCPVKHPNFW